MIISKIERGRQQATSSPSVTVEVGDLVKRMVSAASARPLPDIEASLGQSGARARGTSDCGTVLEEVPRVDERQSASLPPSPFFYPPDPTEEAEPAATPAAAATAVGGKGTAVGDELSAAPGRIVRWSTPFVNSSVRSMHAFCNDIEQAPIDRSDSGGTLVRERQTTLQHDNDALTRKMGQRSEQRRSMGGSLLSERASPAAERLLRARQCVKQTGDEAAVAAGNVRYETGATEVAARLQAAVRLQAAAAQLAEDEAEVAEALAEREAVDITCKPLQRRWSREEHLQRVRNSAAPGEGTTEQWDEATRREVQEGEKAEESMRRAQAKLEGAAERLKQSALALALCEDYNRAFQLVSPPRSLPERGDRRDDDGDDDDDDDMLHRV